MAKFHEKNRLAVVGLQADAGANFKAPTGTGTLTNVTVTIGSTPVFTCDPARIYLGMEINLTGSNTNALITGYPATSKYYVKSIATKTTAGVTGFTLSATRGGSSVGTTGTAGTTGLTFTYNGMTGVESIAVTEINGDTNRETGSFQFLGDSLTRDEYSYEKDRYGEFSLTTYNQLLMSTATPIDPDSNSIWKLLQACGMNVVVDATSGEVYADNGTESPDYATIDLLLSTPDDPTYDKLYKFYDLRGNIDVSASLGEPPQLKFNFKGNSDISIVTPKKYANFGQQTTAVAPRIQNDTIYKAELIDVGSTTTFPTSLGTVSTKTAAKSQMILTFASAHNIPVGSMRRIRVAGFTTDTTYNGDFVCYAISTTKVIYHAKGGSALGAVADAITVNMSAITPQAFCFGNLNITNYSGFEYERFVTGCEQGFSKTAVPFDVSVSMLEDQVGGSSFDPVANLSNFYAIALTFGVLNGGNLQAGKSLTYLLNKVQLANSKTGRVGKYIGQDVTMRSTGLSMMYWR